MRFGVIAGLWAEKFDHMASVTNFIIVPLSFLSGTFYSIDRLPDFLKIISKLNPFFYMIDGFRYSFIEQSDGSVKNRNNLFNNFRICQFGLLHICCIKKDTK